MNRPEFKCDHKFKENCLTAEEVEIVYDWLALAIFEGGGTYGDEFRAWFPVIKKLMPPSLYREIAWFIHSERDASMAQEFLEYVGIED